jgi:type II secretory pathway pseudopilin PulG
MRKREHKILKIQTGFTLVELILYVALVSIFVTAAIGFVWNIIYGREKSYNQQIVQENARIAMTRIAYEIRRAKDIVSVGSGLIILDAGDGTFTTIELTGDSIQLTSNGLGPYNLTSNQVLVNSLTFVNYTSSDNSSKNIKIALSMTQSQQALAGETTAETSVESSIELNGQFNEARQALFDYTNESLISGTSLTGLVVQNTGTSDFAIDKMVISWSGTGGGENVTGVQIGGGSIEWVGSAASGTILDLTDYSVGVSAGLVDIDFITFDASMDGATLDITYVLSDGSNVASQIQLSASSGGTPTPTATPTQTPTPTATPAPGSCTTVCTSGGYTTGTCRKNAQSCSSSGEIYLPGGDVYCTGGANADTCCCI